MKASVQYNDFVGTSAADISDHTDLKEFLTSKKVDTEKYEPFGAGFYSGYSDFFSAKIICRDKEKSTSTKPHIVSLSFEITKDDFFELFKRFHVIIYEEYDKDSDLDIDETITIYEE
ncbi:hypothetical protein SOM12_14950 [Flavobacterium sp. CFBP9031]|uniref:hypothetical protein n=1 Tax=Flavobacterium sp. CFBP9031 TaxID=3096538 RepID=UPI002A6A8FCB|nr:hypothetical protein [Flavobacterium sp. CFBP9031]MDY0988727.1 hypothetical protein [Flavobacterium sp. CFBP9031]